MAYHTVANSEVANKLTEWERELLRLMADGKGTKEIAYLLQMNVTAVWARRTNLMRKIKIHDAASLVRYAVWNGLLMS